MTDAQDIILHWYPLSPFSQKIAWVLNYKKVEYKTVLIDRVEPRPHRRPLDGGYRKTPTLQIGNHVYCDTKAILSALEKLFPEPSLYPKFTNGTETTEGVSRALSMWVDNSLFMNIVTQFPVSVLDDEFLNDRSAFTGRDLQRETLTAISPFMRSTVQAEFDIAVKALGSKTWVFETESPSLADFSLAMDTFFILNLLGEKWVSTNLKPLFEHMQRTLSVADFERTETMPVLTAEEAVEVLKRHQDAEIEADFKVHSTSLPIELDQQVFVTPLDTGKVPVAGTLIRSTIDETVISHKNADYGTTAFIHFPAIGFVVMPNTSAK